MKRQIVKLWTCLVLAAGPSFSSAAARERYALEIGGRPSGWLGSVDGADSAAAGQEVEITFGAGMGAELYEWLRATLAGEADKPHRDLTIVVTDKRGKELRRHELKRALVAVLGFPALAKGKRSPAAFRLLVKAEHGRPAASSGGKYASPFRRPVRWVTSGFRLNIDGAALAGKVDRIGELVVRQAIAQRDERLEAVKVELPRLVVRTKASHARDLVAWHGGAAPVERRGSLELLAAGDAFWTLPLGGLEIASLQSSPKRVTVELTLKRMGR
jgi:hypothetical protein